MFAKQLRRLAGRVKREFRRRRELAIRHSGDLSYVILTMSRGDESRIEEWVRYHAAIGITDFYVILDDPIDDTESVLKKVCDELKVGLQIDIKEAFGEYYNELPAEEWRVRNSAWRENLVRTNQDPSLSKHSALAHRQSMYFPEVLAHYDERSKAGEHGWLALIDVDEFIVPLKWPDIPTMTKSFPEANRLRFLNFNFDTSNHDPAKPFLEQHVYRWSREGIEAFGKGWDKRVKTIAWWGNLTPYAGVHRLSKGKGTTIDYHEARLHHFNMGMMTHSDIPAFEVKDMSTFELWSERTTEPPNENF